MMYRMKFTTTAICKAWQAYFHKQIYTIPLLKLNKSIKFYN